MTETETDKSPLAPPPRDWTGDIWARRPKTRATWLSEPAEGRKRRRPSGRLVALLVALVALAVPVVLVEANRWLDGQVKLEEGSFGFTPTLIVNEDLRSDGEGAYAFVPYRHGEDYTFEFSVYNDGRDVRITDIPFPDTGYLEPVEVRIQHDPFGERPGAARTATVSDIDASVPFEPFTFRAGEQIGVFVRTRFANCDMFSGGLHTSYPDQEFVVDALWGTRHIDVEFAYPVTVGARFGSEVHPDTVLGPGCRP